MNGVRSDVLPEWSRPNLDPNGDYETIAWTIYTVKHRACCNPRATRASDSASRIYSRRQLGLAQDEPRRIIREVGGIAVSGEKAPNTSAKACPNRLALGPIQLWHVLDDLAQLPGHST